MTRTPLTNHSGITPRILHGGREGKGEEGKGRESVVQHAYTPPAPGDAPSSLIGTHSALMHAFVVNGFRHGGTA